MASTRTGTSAADADTTDQPTTEHSGQPDQRAAVPTAAQPTGAPVGDADETMVDVVAVTEAGPAEDAPPADEPRGDRDDAAMDDAAMDDAAMADGSTAGAPEQVALAPIRIPAHLLEMPGPASPSPSGSDAAYYQRSATGGWDLVFAPLAGGPAEIIELPVALEPTLGPEGDTAARTGPVWSPDGHFLALTCLDPDSGRDAIFVLDTQTGLFRPLVSHAADDRSPSWSPDSRVVAFTSTVNGRDRIAIVEANPPEGVTPYAIYLTDGVQDDRDPVWLRDGLEVAFRRRLADPATDNLYIVSIVTGELRQVTGREGRVGLGSQPAYRHSPISSPDKPQIAYATNEKDWDLIAIANSENGTGWTLAGEAGDKVDPQWAPDGKKVAYSRTLGTVTNVCTKGTAAAVTEILDPGNGVARHPRWLADGRIIYWYMDSVRAPRLILQEAGAKLPRTVLGGPANPAATIDTVGEMTDQSTVAITDPGIEPSRDTSAVGTDTETPADGATAPDPIMANAAPPRLASVTAPKPDATTNSDAPTSDVTGEQVRATIEPISADFVTPTVVEVQTPDRLKLPGLLYQPAKAVGSIAVLSVGHGPPNRIDQRPDLIAQVLVEDGYPVFQANLRGTPGLGRGVLNGLADLADFEAETDDVVAAAQVLRADESVDASQLAIMGSGFGGSLALTGAGGRPGQFAAVVAIDPITDWDRAFDEMVPAERVWYQDTFGLPIVEAGRYALRTPSTFAGVIDAPILLVTTSIVAADGLTPLTDVLAELNVGYEHIDLSGRESDGEIGEAIAVFLGTVVRG